MTQTNWYQSIMNGFGLQDCITVTKIGVIANDLAVLSHSNSIVNVYIKDVCQIEDKTEYRVIYYFNANLPKLIVSDSMDSLMNKIVSLRAKNKAEESTPMNNENSRIPFPFYYLSIAEAVSKRSTCLSKRYGAVIVKDNSIKSTGYNGAPKGRKNCTEIGYCPRITNNTQRGTNYAQGCRSCLSKDTVIKLLDGEYKTIEELYNSKEDSFWVYAIDTKTSQIVSAKANNVHPVKHVDSLIRVTLDNGKSFECTDDHLIMLTDCTYITAGKLSIGDSLMTMYYSCDEVIKAGKQYNYKVTNIESIDYDDYVYDMTVPEYHNFAIDLGDNSCVFVHNCHSEWNAIINASPEEMKDATLYLYGYDRVAKRIVKDANCCPICKRMIINAGIKDVVIADLDNGIGHPEVPYRYRTIKVADWIENDESLQANEGY